jgi:hypothetical protein
MLLGPAVHRATYAAAAARKRSSGSSDPPDGEGDWPVDQLSDWATDSDADRLVVELWVGGVEGLAARQPGAGERGD